MSTPREFKKKLWFPILFVFLAFLEVSADLLSEMMRGFDFSFNSLLSRILLFLSTVAISVTLILFGRKKPKDTILPISLIFGIPAISCIYFTLIHISEGSVKSAMISSFTAILLVLVLSVYILTVLGILREKTFVVIFDGLLIAYELCFLPQFFVPYFRDFSLFYDFAFIASNLLGFLYMFSEAALFSLPIFYVYALKKVEPPVVNIALTTQEKIAMIDKLYFMFQKGEITEAEYVEKKKSLLKEI